MLELAKEALDRIALAIDVSADGALDQSLTGGRDMSLGAAGLDSQGREERWCSVGGGFVVSEAAGPLSCNGRDSRSVSLPIGKGLSGHGLASRLSFAEMVSRTIRLYVRYGYRASTRPYRRSNDDLGLKCRDVVADRDYDADALLHMEPMATRTAPARTAAQHQSLLHFVANAVWSDEDVGLPLDLAVDAFERIGNRYEISRCQRSAAVFYIVAYGAIIWTEAPGARIAGRPIHTMSRELELVAGRLSDSPGCAESANPYLSCRPQLRSCV